MSWIHEIEPGDACGDLKAVYTDLQRSRGKIANILKVHGLRPTALRAHLDLYMDLMFAPSGLSRRAREMIAVVVSRANDCAYCVAHHREALSRYVDDLAVLDAVSRGQIPASEGSACAAICRYAVKLTRTPDAMTEADVETLREAGLPDEDILLLNLIVAYFNFVNRIALGLGVQFDADEVSGYRG